MLNKRMMQKIIFISILFLPIWLIAQENDNYSGRIINGQNLEPLPFANIAYINSSIGTTSDENGKFILKKNNNFEQIIISYVGFKSVIIPINKINTNKENLITLFPIEIFLQEVTVYSSQKKEADLREANSLSIQSEQIRTISAAMPDIMRSVQALPGISVNNEFKADFNVRGGNQDENLILVNGAQVYQPYHIKEAANASVGIFNVDLIEKVDLITGGYSARYGDKMSSVLNIKFREGNRINYSGAGSVSLAFADAYLEGPITEKSSFILGVRKSYMEYVLSMIDFEDINTAQPSFYDIQGVLSYHLTPANTLLFEFIQAGDKFTYTPGKSNLRVPIISTHNGEQAVINIAKIEDEDNDATYYSSLFDIQSKNIISNQSILNVGVSYYNQSDDEYRLFERYNSQNIATIQNNLFYFDTLFTERLTYDSLTIETFEAKANFLYQFNPFYEINSGISLQNIHYKQRVNDLWTYIRTGNLDNVDIIESDTLQRYGIYGEEKPVDALSYKYNFYVENIFQITNDFTLNLGGRLDYFDINRDHNISPRVNFAFNLGNQFILRGAWGHFYQSPDYRQLISSERSDTNTQAQKAEHYILGMEKTSYFNNRLDQFFKIKIEGYYKKYSDLISSWYGTFERLTYSKRNDAEGNAMGIDLYLALSIPSLYTWLSYGLLFATENKLDDDIGEYPRYTDQTHMLSIITNIDLGKDWNIVLKGYYGSGFPYTPKMAEQDEDGEWFWKSKEIHSKYLPAYKRVDFRISKTFVFKKSSLNTFIDVSNIFNFKNIQNYKYETPGYTKPVTEEVLLWPIIPSFGIRWQF